MSLPFPGTWRRIIAIVLLVVAVILAITAIAIFPRSTATGSLATMTDVSLPAGGTSAFDHEALDPTNGHLFIAHPGGDDIVVFDTTTNKVIGRILSRLSLPAACQHDHGLILDETQHLGFAVCDGNSMAVMFDIQNMKVVSSVQSVGNTPDLLAFDESRHLLYVSSHSGVLTIFSDQNATFQQVYQSCIATNAHSIIVDPITHKIYMPLIISQQPDTCPSPAAKSKATTTATAQAKSTAPTGPRILRIFLFHYNGI